jgi:cytochrome c peroxidase
MILLFLLKVFFFPLGACSSSLKKMKVKIHLSALPLAFLTIMLTACGTTGVEPAHDEAELGERLFFDPILSRDSSISCASCHKPEHAFADNVALTPGVFHRTGTRNTPSVMNQVNRNAYFWDGRASSLAEQALGPMENMVEMDFPITLSVRRLLRSSYYSRSFMNVYGRRPDRELMGKALAAFEETLETSDTPFDDYLRDGDSTALSASAKRGLDLFNTKGGCFDCHFGVDFTGGDQFRNIGLFNGKNLNDSGRYLISRSPRDIGAFKIPGLRNVAQTAPYMHNGMFRTLDEVIDYYNDPDAVVPDAQNRDSLLSRPLLLTKEERADLKAFLLSLSDRRFLNKSSRDLAQH